MLWGAAALHPSMRSLEQPSAERAGPADLAPARTARRSVLDRAGNPLRAGLRERGCDRADDRVGSVVPARRRADGRSRAPGGASGVTRARAEKCGRPARRGGWSGADPRRRDLGGPSAARRRGRRAPRAWSRPPGRRSWRQPTAARLARCSTRRGDGSTRPGPGCRSPLQTFPPAVSRRASSFPPGDFAARAAAVDAGRGSRPPRDLLARQLPHPSCSTHSKGSPRRSRSPSRPPP